MTAFNAERLVAGLAVGIQVETEDDVVMLGKAFIEQLIRYRKEEESLRTNHQLSLQKTAEWLSAQTASSLQVAAAQYDNPRARTAGELTDEPCTSWSADVLDRKEGSTTLNLCGWCSFAIGGARGGRCSTPLCGLLPSSTEAGRPLYKTFSTPCVFTNGGGKEVVGRSQRYISEQLRQVAGAKDEARQAMALLSSLLEKAEDKPLVAALRPADWFSIGDDVRYFTGDAKEPFVCAKVLYRYEGSVFVACTNGVGMQMRPRCFDVKDASLLKEGEYAFLHAHSVFCRWWYSTAIQQSSELLNTTPDSGVLARAVMA